MADVGDIKSGSLAHQYYPGRLPHLRSPSLSSFHPSRTPREGSTCRRGVGARTGTPSFAGTAYPSTHGDGVGLSRPFAAYVVSDRARSWDRPALGRCSPGLAATSVLPADTRGRGEPQAGRGTADGLGRCHWRRATASGHSPPSLAASRRSSAVQSPHQVASCRRLFSHPIRRLASAPVLPAACQIPSLPCPLSQRGQRTRESVPTA